MGGASSRVQGDKEVMMKLLGMKSRTADLSPALERIGEMFREHEANTFATEGTSVAHPWQALSPRYAAWKLSKVGPKPIMQFSGAMFASFTIKDAPGNISLVGPKTAHFGSSVTYVKYHQSRAPRRVLPRRPVIVLTPTYRAATKRVLRRWITHGEL